MMLPDLFARRRRRGSPRSTAARLERLHRAGYLRPAFFAAASLGNVSRLIELKNRKVGAD